MKTCLGKLYFLLKEDRVTRFVASVMLRHWCDVTTWNHACHVPHVTLHTKDTHFPSCPAPSPAEVFVSGIHFAAPFSHTTFSFGFYFSLAYSSVACVSETTRQEVGNVIGSMTWSQSRVRPRTHAKQKDGKGGEPAHSFRCGELHCVCPYAPSIHLFFHSGFDFFLYISKLQRCSRHTELARSS